MATRRSNNTGSICIEKRTGKYRAAVSVNGKRVVKRFSTEDDAVRWLTITQAEIYQNKFSDPTKVTLQEFAEEYMETCCSEIRPTSYNIYVHLLEKLSPLYKRKLQSITSMDIQRCINGIDVCPRTKVQIRNFAKRIFAKAMEMDLLSKNPAESVTITKAKKQAVNPIKPEDIFTSKEIDKILFTAKDHGYSRNYYLFILTAVLTGMRIGEILGLKYQDVKPGYINVRSSVVLLLGHKLETLPKTEAGARTISVPKQLTDMLLANDPEGMLPTDYVFHTKNKAAWNPNNVQTEWKRILEKAGVPHKNFHKLRHYHASMLVQNQVSFLDVAKRLGHSNPNITIQIYSHSVPGYNERMLDKVIETFPLIEG